MQNKSTNFLKSKWQSSNPEEYDGQNIAIISQLIKNNIQPVSIFQTKKNTLFDHGMSEEHILEDDNAEVTLDELQIMYKKDSPNDKRELFYLVHQLLGYPENYPAIVHMEAERLGNYDFKRQRKQSEQQGLDCLDLMLINLKQYFVEKQQQDLEQINKQMGFKCPCCDKVRHKQPLPVFTNLKYIQSIGISIYLFFFTLKNLIYLLIFMFFIFSATDIVFNTLASQQYKMQLIDESKALDTKITFHSYMAMSIGSKVINIQKSQTANLGMIVQCYLLIITIVFWFFFFIRMKIKEHQYEEKLDYDEVSASDYTLQFSRVPTALFLDDELTEQFQRQLIEYCEQNKHQYPQLCGNLPFEIKESTTACPFDFKGFSSEEEQNNSSSERIKQVEHQHQIARENLLEILRNRQSSQQFREQFSVQVRSDRYAIFKSTTQVKTSQKKAYYEHNLVNQVNQSFEKILDIPTITMFITFGSTFQKQFIQKLNSKHNRDFCASRTPFIFKMDNREHEICIQSAPEPEDIKWQNYFQTTLVRRLKIALTFIITLVMLSISFIITYQLNKLQQFFNQEQNQTKSSMATVLSIIISVILFIFDIIIPSTCHYILVMIRILTTYEMHTSQTREQISIGYKSIMATILNSIVTPLTVNMMIKDDIYGIDGLADSVFFQALTNSLLTPFTRILINHVQIKAQFIFTTLPDNKLNMNQEQLNKQVELSQFQVGEEYVSIVFMFLFACFYAPLQPIVVLITIFGFIIMYFSQKFILFNQTKRPIKGNNEIGNAIQFLIFLGPLAFSFGSYLWMNRAKRYITMNLEIVHLIAGALSVLILVFPYKELIVKLNPDKVIREGRFQEDYNDFCQNTYDKHNPLQFILGKRKYRQYFISTLEKIKKRKIDGHEPLPHFLHEKPKSVRNLQAIQEEPEQKSLQ